MTDLIFSMIIMGGIFVLLVVLFIVICCALASGMNRTVDDEIEQEKELSRMQKEE